MELAKDDAAVLAYAGYTLAGVLSELEDGISLVDRALELNPNLALAWGVHTENLNRAGMSSEIG